MGILIRSAAASMALALAGCASSQLGFDPFTRTVASAAVLYGKTPGYRITCERGTQSCLLRAEALCGGRYAVVGKPWVSPRVQALVNLRLVSVNTDNPTVIYIACG